MGRGSALVEMRPERLLEPRMQLAFWRWFEGLTHRGIFATDRDLRVIAWNRWMEVHARRPASEVVGRLLPELYPDLVPRGVDQYYRDALAGRISVISHGLHRYLLPLSPTNPHLEFDPMPQSGEVGPLSDGDSVIGTVTTLEDVSDRLASEAELRKQIDAQRMARATAEKALRAKDEFLSTLSHEIRNPLNAVLGWTRILIDGKGLDPALLERALHVIDRNATAQARMIDDLLDVARIVAGKLQLEMQPVDLLAVTLAAIDVIKPSAEVKQIVVRTSLDPNTPTVLGDHDRLQQIIWNLLSNAVKFTDAGGTIDVRLSAVEEMARLIVSDSGHGISPEFLPFVFERFRQNDASSVRRQGGLGLGLALARDLVALHGGTIRAESPGERHGATFTMDLPRAMATEARQNHQSAAASASDPASPLFGIRVLVVENEMDSRDLLVEALSRCGTEVVAARSCAEALAVLRRSAVEDLPHVIVADIGMPDEDGYDLIRQIRALEPGRGGRIPAVAVTGYANPDDRHRVLAAGYQLHVGKPVDLMVLASAVQRVARQAEGS
jgi:signal transduction histidine kinase/CheY-like chemotaxis protein